MKQVQELVKVIEERGGRAKRTTKGHYQIFKGSQFVVALWGTPGSNGGTHGTIGRLRKHGLLPPRGGHEMDPEVYLPDDFDIAKFAKALRKGREKKRLSQKDFGLMVGVSGPTVTQYESMRYRPKLKVFRSIQQVLEWGDGLYGPEEPKVKNGAAEAAKRAKAVLEATSAAAAKSRSEPEPAELAVEGTGFAPIEPPPEHSPYDQAMIDLRASYEREKRLDDELTRVKAELQEVNELDGRIMDEALDLVEGLMDLDSARNGRESKGAKAKVAKARTNMQTLFDEWTAGTRARNKAAKT